VRADLSANQPENPASAGFFFESVTAAWQGPSLLQ